MPRSSWTAMALALAISAPGCTNLFTKQAIERFAEGLQAQDLEQLKSNTSSDFNQKALRQDDAAKGLKALKMPTGEVEIVSVEELEPGKRKAIVKVGKKDAAKEIEYRLSREGRSGRWVVDDVILKQDSGRGALVERSVSEQMDLLLTCRELLMQWKEGTREQRLDFCEEPLKAQLAALPDAWFQCLAKEIVGTGRTGTFRPDARFNGERAVVLVPHPSGSLFLDMARVDDRWLLHDMAVEPTSKASTGITSLTKMCKALNQSAKFLTAYSESDKDALGASSTSTFYEKCLRAADLTEAPLPTEKMLSTSYNAKQFVGRAIAENMDEQGSVSHIEMVFNDAGVTYMLTLREEEPLHEDGSKLPSELRVDEVTLFEKGGAEVKRLSAMFLSHAVVNLYVESLLNRDVARLKELSSHDFNNRVWERKEAMHFAIMQDPDLEPGETSILATKFYGDQAEVTVAQGETPMTLVLKHSKGWMVVDDVQMPALDRPISLKANLEVMLSVHAFASAAHRKDLKGLILYSADGLDRMVWRQFDEAPPLALELVRPMLSEVVSIRTVDSWTVVRTSNGDAGAEVRLEKEGSHFVVHDVTLLSGSGNDAVKLDFLQTMRQDIARRQLSGESRSKKVVPAAASTAPATPEPVKHAVFEPIDSAVYSQ